MKRPLPSSPPCCSREGYDRIVAALNELATRQPNFLFLDIDRKNENDFQDTDGASS